MYVNVAVCFLLYAYHFSRHFPCCKTWWIKNLIISSRVCWFCMSTLGLTLFQSCYSHLVIMDSTILTSNLRWNALFPTKKWCHLLFMHRRVCNKNIPEHPYTCDNNNKTFDNNNDQKALTTTTTKVNKAYHIGMIDNAGAVCGCHDYHTWVALTWHGPQGVSTQFLWC